MMPEWHDIWRVRRRSWQLASARAAFSRGDYDAVYLHLSRVLGCPAGHLRKMIRHIGRQKKASEQQVLMVLLTDPDVLKEES